VLHGEADSVRSDANYFIPTKLFLQFATASGFGFAPHSHRAVVATIARFAFAPDGDGEAAGAKIPRSSYCGQTFRGHVFHSRNSGATMPERHGLEAVPLI
jgi:hypothetical protein